LGIAWIVGVGVYLVMNLLRALRADYWLWKKRQTLSAELQTDTQNLLCTYGFKKFPRIYLMDDINQPFVWGLLRGSIYLPADFVKVNNAEHQRSILGHELSHILRFDAAVNILQVIGQAIFWFHPFVWWANRKIRQEREKCCDEMAIAYLRDLPRDYGMAILETLVAKYESTRPVPSLAVAGPVKNIEERIKTMMKPGKNFYKRPSLVVMTVVLLLSLLTVPTTLDLNAHAETKAPHQKEAEPNSFGKLEYVDHLTRANLASVTSIGTSPDGRYAYAAAYNASALLTFKRDPETGYLEHIQTISDDNDLNGAVKARVSPDGRYVVCVSFRSNTVSLFERDSSKGLLNRSDIVRKDERGGPGLSWVIDAVFSPDSKFVYTIADHGQGAAVSVFRITQQAKLELIQTNTGEDKCFAGARGIAISPKGDSLYVTSYQASNLVVLDIDTQSRKTKVRQIIKDEQGDVHSLGGAFSVACSPNGDFVYTSAGRFVGDNAVCVFKRTSDGTLSFVQEIFDGQKGLAGFVGGNELLVSQDGKNLYVLGSRSNSVVVFKRNLETGELIYLQTFYDSEVAGEDGSASGIGISPDGEYVYVAGEGDNSILIFKRLTGTKKRSADTFHGAASSGDIAQVKSLIAEGADVNKKAERGYTSLHCAVKAGYKDVAQLIIANGADINTRTGSRGWTPLHIAVMQSNKDMAEWLISKGADLNAANQNNELTPLLITGMSGKTDLAELLISKGANVSTCDNYFKTPLHYAARNGHGEVVQLLIRNQADIEAKSGLGYTALHYASIYGHVSVAQLLIEKGADVNARTTYGGSIPLHLACLRGQKDVVEMLIAKGADINAKDNEGQTALSLAKAQGRDEIAELLRRHGAKE